MDPNWIMAIIALSAIFSPTIVSIVDNIFRYQSEKLELQYPNQRNALSNFVNKAMLCYPKNITFQIVTEYNVAKNDLYIYFNNVPGALLDNLDKYKKEQNLDKYKTTINQIIKRLSAQLNK